MSDKQPDISSVTTLDKVVDKLAHIDRSHGFLIIGWHCPPELFECPRNARTLKACYECWLDWLSKPVEEES